MTDGELLNLAAKAAGYWSDEYQCVDKLPHLGWNPLSNDSDALRLSVSLELNIRQLSGTTVVSFHESHLASEHLGDPHTRTRRAIVRAAAEIVRATP